MDANLKPYKVFFHYLNSCICDPEQAKVHDCYCEPDVSINFVDASDSKHAEQQTLEAYGEDSISIRFAQELPYKFLNVYLCDRAYGGPEEGGWYYNTGTPVVSIPLIPSILKHLKEIEAELKQTYTNEGRRPISSVLSDGEYCITIEFEQAESYPKERPHYE